MALLICLYIRRGHSRDGFGPDTVSWNGHVYSVAGGFAGGSN